MDVHDEIMKYEVRMVRYGFIILTVVSVFMLWFDLEHGGKYELLCDVSAMIPSIGGLIFAKKIYKYFMT